jgi:hypothetical protein
MDSYVLEKHTDHLLAAIETCMKDKFTLPALILLYSTIDIMAWLNRSEEHPDVTRSDFIQWVDTFLLPDSDLSCTAIDLYAARCSLIHSYIAESKLSRESKASEIYYAWGSAQEQHLQALIEWVSAYDAKAVHVEKLLDALKIGISRFLASTQQSELIRTRAGKFFTNIPTNVEE